ncbi:MAG: lipoprotein signal peptidase [Bacteroidales bacterium]|jgi:signal peptidase II|nr:lipoprotein signal peptidase [Bacteroidales bacterium]MDD3161129.1 lipoprotein signal peptidase [Bacteroidales bacterium]
MSLKTKRISVAIGVPFLILLIDQLVKIWVKTHMMINDSFHVTDWFYIYFTENPGMAFGMELFDKLFLTSFRLIAMGVLIWYLAVCIKKEFKIGYIISIAAIFAGATGNIVDCVFYGQLFSHSYGQVATFLPEMGGYAPWLHGKVVDMLYFPLIETTFPDWVPFWGGDSFVFFRPIFNIADSAITCGIFSILIFYREYLSDDHSKAGKETTKNSD